MKKLNFGWLFVLLLLFTAVIYPAGAKGSGDSPLESQSRLVFSGDSLQQKANINTSRSNIKRPKKSSDIGVNEPGVNRKEKNKGDQVLPAGQSTKNEKAAPEKK